MKFKSDVQLESLNNATTDTDKFLVSDGSTVKYRTGAQVLSDIGGQSALTNPITGTGTTNYVPKFTGATSLGNSQVFDNGTNVGIGTTSPAYTLDVNGNINISSAQFLRYNGTTGIIGSATSITGGTSSQLGIRSATDILFSTGGSTEKMRITSTGNVGIGTSSPQDKLDVNGSIRFRSNTPNLVAVTDNAVLDYVPTSIFPTSPCIRLSAIGTSTVGADIRFQTGTSSSLGEKCVLLREEM